LRNPTKLLILVEMLDLLTTLIGITLFGLSEKTPWYFGWDIENLVMIKLLCVCIMITILEQPREYGWLAWIPSVIATLAVFGNIYAIMTV
jgi:hypothetical protein